jgi:sugar phosphate isomerase/epimerase
VTRRDVFAMPAALAAIATDAAAYAEAADDSGAEFKIGICSYTFREFQRKMAIDMMKQLGVGYASVKDVHLSYSLTPEELAKAVGEFKKAGFTLTSAGNTDLQSTDPAVLRRYFQYARDCRIPMLVAAPTHESLPAVEKLAKEFDIKVAIHPHGPEDKHFPVPRVVLEAVKGMDSRMGMCLDIGHATRGGADLLQEIANAGPRLFDMHMKDLKSGQDKDSQCAVGEGVLPIVAIFKQLKKVGYRGCVNLEYEIESENPLPGAQHSIGYMKGVVAGLAG